jgi:hypothetical protein
MREKRHRHDMAQCRVVLASQYVGVETVEIRLSSKSVTSKSWCIKILVTVWLPCTRGSGHHILTVGVVREEGLCSAILIVLGKRGEKGGFKTERERNLIFERNL